VSAYKETRIKTASQGQLVIMLYDAAVKSLDRSLDILDKNSKGKKDPGKIEHISKAVLKAQEIVTELSASLDFEQGGEIAQNLFALYTWFNQELLEANIKQDMNRIAVVRNMINELKSAWTEIITRNTPGNTGRAVSGINIAG
jgi:flagellar protein FliS